MKINAGVFTLARNITHKHPHSYSQSYTHIQNYSYTRIQTLPGKIHRQHHKWPVVSECVCFPLSLSLSLSLSLWTLIHTSPRKIQRQHDKSPVPHMSTERKKIWKVRSSDFIYSKKVLYRWRWTPAVQYHVDLTTEQPTTWTKPYPSAVPCWLN